RGLLPAGFHPECANRLAHPYRPKRGETQPPLGGIWDPGDPPAFFSGGPSALLSGWSLLLDWSPRFLGGGVRLFWVDRDDVVDDGARDQKRSHAPLRWPVRGHRARPANFA